MPLIEANGAHLNYCVEGSGEPVFLLFNGNTLRLEFWGELAVSLSALGRVVRFDQRAVGGTVAPAEPFTVETVAADAHALLDALGIARVVAVGHAWGGRVAQVFARDFPERVRALIICGTGGFHPPADNTSDQEAIRAAAARADRPAWEEAMLRLYCSTATPARQPERTARIADELWSARSAPRPAPSPPREQPVSSASYWGTTRAPALLIYGREDRMGTATNARDLHARLPGSRLVFVDDAAHFVIREQPERVLAEITRFVPNL